MSEKVFIIDSARLTVGRYGGVFKDNLPEELGAHLLDAMLERNGIDAKEIDQIILGNVVAGGGNVARKVGLLSKLPVTTPAVTVDMQCSSGLEAINIARAKIIADDADLIVCGGVESTSRAPWQMEKPHNLYGRNPRVMARQQLSTGEYGDPDMGYACERLAEKYEISRLRQDEFACNSQNKYELAKDLGIFDKEIIEFDGINQDECPRAGTTIEKLAKLRPAFEKDGTITAGNCCPLNDGAGLTFLASQSFCQENKISPKFEVIASASVGIDPIDFGLGPAVAIEALLKKTNISINDIDRFEINESFAAQVLASMDVSNIPSEKVNISGGAIAFGHPFGASGAILIRRLMTELEREESLRLGIVAMCVGGGQGSAIMIKKVSNV